jgi:hypothetical protein
MDDPLQNPEALIATLARICELERREVEAELLKNCTVELEQTDYDNWNGGTYIYGLYLQVTPERYAQISSRLKSVEKIILEHAKALIRHNPNDHIGQVVIVPKVSASSITPLRVYAVSTNDLMKDIDAQRSLMITVATGGPRIQSVNAEYQDRRLRIRKGLDEREIDDPNPFEDLWAWYGKWSSGDLPTYQSRRQFISDLYASLLNQIRARDSGNSSSREIEPTGWVKVDRGLHLARRQLEAATTEEQFQAVGLLCRETLISVAQTVYDPEQHSTLDGVKPSKTDAKRVLEAYISTTLSGTANEVSRKHAKAALDLANELQHKRTAIFRDAALCAEATTSVVNLIAIISGERDPEK